MSKNYFLLLKTFENIFLDRKLFPVSSHHNDNFTLLRCFNIGQLKEFPSIHSNAIIAKMRFFVAIKNRTSMIQVVLPVMGNAKSEKNGFTTIATSALTTFLLLNLYETVSHIYSLKICQVSCQFYFTCLALLSYGAIYLS